MPTEEAMASDPDARRPPAGHDASRSLPLPEPGRRQAERYVADHLRHLVDTSGAGTFSSAVFRGGQVAADAALAALDLTGYAEAGRRAYPQHRRRTSALSPWIRHGLLSLTRVWDHVHRLEPSPPPVDLDAFAHALAWQEFARHRYARRAAGVVTVGGSPPSSPDAAARDDRRRGHRSSDRSGGGIDERGSVWDRRLGCVQITLDELEDDGWLVDEGRRWLASQWAVRHGRSPAEGERHFVTHLLDGSRAANGLAWELVTAPDPAGRFRFSRWEVEARAAGLCATCELVHRCPIERPIEGLGPGEAPPPDPGFVHDVAPERTAGPREATATATGLGPGLGLGPGRGAAGAGQAEAVWLTAESLGDDDPALVAHPDLPAVFVFDEPLLARLRLSAKRFVFLVETLAELACRRRVEIVLGDPRVALAHRPLAVTFTPVPGWRRHRRHLDVASVHPWPWLVWPDGGDVASFEGWWRSALPHLQAGTQTSTGRNARAAR
ncbi:MAG: deoxyribodipyrimidine photolyase [Acidimicrobiales bacterium]